MAKVKFNGKVYRPAKFNEGLQLGTVEWELMQRQIRAQNRRDDKQWEAMQAARAAEPKPMREHLFEVWDSLYSKFRGRPGAESSAPKKRS
jgi:hypothetical protein